MQMIIPIIPVFYELLKIRSTGGALHASHTLMRYSCSPCLLVALSGQLFLVAHQIAKRLFLLFNYYLCDKQGYCNRVLDFFHANNFVHRTHLDVWDSSLPGFIMYLIF